MRGYELEVEWNDQLLPVINNCIKDYNKNHRVQYMGHAIYPKRRRFNEYLLKDYGTYISWRKETICFKKVSNQTWFIMKFS